jgi:AraC-like DNA-binding protein
MPGAWAESGFDSLLAERVKLTFLDLSIPESEITAKAIAERVGCSESHVRNIMSAHALTAARKELIRGEARHKAERLSLCMQDTVNDAVVLSSRTIRNLTAIAQESEDLRQGRSNLSDEEKIVRLKILEAVSKIHKIAGNEAMAVQTQAARLAELSKHPAPALTAAEEKLAIGTAVNIDAALWDDDY